MQNDGPSQLSPDQAAELATFRRGAWNQETIADAGRLWEQRFGSPPDYRRWRYAGPWWPSLTTVKKFYGSWRQFQQAMGWPVSTKPAPATPIINDNEILQAVREFYAEGGDTQTLYAQWARLFGYPSLSLLQQRLETWITATNLASVPSHTSLHVKPELWDAQWLRQHYVDQQLTVRAISQLLFGKDNHQGHLVHALRRAGIPTRRRGGSQPRQPS